ncbi:hypothetical protein CK203_111213 [Vitis vinifera]|uniref:Uncharacterized protein n=1 Tax=Vitis vinifera TaxID=29760 RepID=A0A438F8K8_VITVI|nr:hypothetical protein CK203_111213 [Vitis vinifera]
MSEGKNMREDDNEKGSDNNPWARSNGQDEEKGEGMRLWGIFLFSLIGATVTTFAVGQFRRTAGWFYTQAKLIKYVTSLKKFARSQSSRNGATGSSFRSSFQEEAWKRYNRRMQEEYEEEMERVGRSGTYRVLRLKTLFDTLNSHRGIVGIGGPLDLERIKRMQSVFNRERNKYKRSYESWREMVKVHIINISRGMTGIGKTDTSYKYQRANSREIPRDRTSASYPLSHHYLTLGLDR